MAFVVRSPRNNPDVAEVRYDCECGCKPRARFEKGTDDAGHEHCCCGQVHFVGAHADARLKEYLDDRATRNEDADVGVYTFHTQAVDARSVGRAGPGGLRRTRAPQGPLTTEYPEATLWRR